MTPRCPWAGTDPRMRAYHDDEWGVPVHDDTRLFDSLMQATGMVDDHVCDCFRSSTR